MMRALELQKGTFWDKVALNSEEIKPIALVVIELHLSEGVSQSIGWSVGQSVEILLHKKFLKFYINLREGFMIDLKTFLSFFMPNQCCLNV